MAIVFFILSAVAIVLFVICAVREPIQENNKDTLNKNLQKLSLAILVSIMVIALAYIIEAYQVIKTEREIERLITESEEILLQQAKYEMEEEMIKEYYGTYLTDVYCKLPKENTEQIKENSLQIERLQEGIGDTFSVQTAKWLLYFGK